MPLRTGRKQYNNLYCRWISFDIHQLTLVWNNPPMIRSSIYRLHPGTLRRNQLLSQIAGANRYVWNWAIGQNRDAMKAYEEGKGEKPSPTFFNLGLAFTRLRSAKGHEWLRELPYAEVRYVLKRYADAMGQARKGKRGFPKFKHREDGDSFTIPQDVQIANGKLYVTKVGWVPISRQGGDPWAYGEAKQAVVVKRPDGKWYVSVFWKVPDINLEDNGKAIGLDVGKWNVATTEQEQIFMPEVSGLETKLKRHKRKMSRRQRVPLLDANGIPRRTRQGDIIKTNSSRREKERRIVAKLSRKIANIRDNWRHHLSHDLAERFGMICLEDLNIEGMMKSAKGTLEKPGKNVKAKSALNREIAASGWGRLRWMLEYKAHRVEAVNPAYTSQTCHRCGHVAEENRRKERFKCVSCGYAGNADINAAFNILALGTGAAGQGGAFASVRAGPSGRALSCDPDDLSMDIQGLLAGYCV